MDVVDARKPLRCIFPCQQRTAQYSGRGANSTSPTLCIHTPSSRSAPKDLRIARLTPVERCWKRRKRAGRLPNKEACNLRCGKARYDKRSETIRGLTGAPAVVKVNDAACFVSVRTMQVYHALKRYSEVSALMDSEVRHVLHFENDHECAQNGCLRF